MDDVPFFCVRVCVCVCVYLCSCVCGSDRRNLEAPLRVAPEPIGRTVHDGETRGARSS